MWRERHLLAASTVFMVALAARQAPGLQGTVRLGDPSVAPAPGVTFDVPVYVDAAGLPLGAYTFAVSYDPAVVRIQSVRSGTVPEFDGDKQGGAVSNPETFAKGYTLVTAHQGESLVSPTGEKQVCVLTFQVPSEVAEPAVISYTVTPVALYATDTTSMTAAQTYHDVFYGTTDSLVQMLVDGLVEARLLYPAEARILDRNGDGKLTVADIVKAIQE